MSNMLALLAATGGGAPKLYAEDCFSAYTYVGNGSTQTITNGIDLAGKGGMIWTKDRDDAYSHAIVDTARGNTKVINSDLTQAEQTKTDAITAFTASGYTLGADASWWWNKSTRRYVSWTFRNAPKFFHHQQVTKSAGSNATVDLSTLGTVGMVKVKRTDSTGSWYVWHRSLSAGKLLIGETTAAEATMGHITVSGTTLTLVNGVIADGTYHVEAYAHDTGADSLIQCGSFTADGSGNATVNLGWEPQYLIVKQTTTTSAWICMDSARGFTVNTSQYLYTNDSIAESNATYWEPTATGFKFKGLWANQTVLYLAIRRPNKPPTLGTQVYNAIARTGTGAAATVTGVGFAPDLLISTGRAGVGGFSTGVWDRLRGASPVLASATAQAEQAQTVDLAAFIQDGYTFGTSAGWGWTNASGRAYVHNSFRRAPGFFDIVAYTGIGTFNVTVKTESHGLGVVPEMIIYKNRNASYGWAVYHKDLGAANNLNLESNLAAQADGNILWNNTPPTSTQFTMGKNPQTQNGGNNFVAYLFATLAGISKVGSYTGNGTSQNLDCGFTAGARFCLIKRTDAASDWMLADSTRGIIAGSDPRLSLNTTAAEVTTDDWLDPFAAGFTVNQTAASNANVLNGSYIYLAIA